MDDLLNTCWVKKHRKIYDLPEELLAQIFKRLGRNDLRRCRFVQKSWYYLIQTPTFLDTRANYRGITTGKRLPFFDILYAQRLKRCFDDCPFWYALSHGLTCTSLMFDIHRFNPNIYIWNPVIQNFDTLPPSPLPCSSGEETLWRALAFGFVPETNDHVVIHVVKYRNDDEYNSVWIGVYNLSTNSWKKRRQDDVIIRGIATHHVAFVNGTAYWIGISWKNYKILVSFDTKTEFLRDDILLPDYYHYLDEDRGYYDYTIYPYGQSVAYFLFNSQLETCDMWVLEGPIAESSWEDEGSWKEKMSVCMSKNVWTTEVLGSRSSGEPGLARLYDLMISYI